MNADRLEKWILLEQSGELDPVRRWMLRRALRANAAARRFQQEAADIARRVREEWTAPELDRVTRASILQAARDPRDDRPPVSGFGWRSAWAVAAVLLLLVAGYLSLWRGPVTDVARVETAVQLPWTDDLDAAIAELNTMVAQADDPWDADSASSDLDSMAENLMQWEESNI